MSIWAPVVAALGASLLTGAFTWCANLWLEHRRNMREKSAAYHQLISRSLTFSGRTEALRNIMESVSGLKDDGDSPFRLRRRFDQIDIYDWLEKDYIPINDAWSKIQMIGSPEAVDGGTRLLDACADLLGIATTPDAQQPTLQVAGRRVIDAREDFIQVVRKDLGEESTAVLMESSRHQGDAEGARLELGQATE